VTVNLYNLSVMGETMKEHYEYVLLQLNMKDLENIIRIGNYNLTGFRLNGVESKPKRQKIINLLTENIQKLHKNIKIHAEQLSMENKINNIWAYKKNLTVEDVKNNLLQPQKNRNIYLELLSADRLDVIADLYNQSWSEKKFEDLNDDVIIINNSENVDNDKDNNEQTIKNLRHIIKNLESNILSHQHKKEDMQNQINLLKESIGIEENKLAKMKENNNDLKKHIQNLEKKNTLYEKKLKKYEKDNLYFEKKIKEIEKTCILVVAPDRLEQWFKNKEEEKIKFEFCDVTSIDNKLNNQFFEEIWLIEFNITNIDIQGLLENHKFYLYHKLNKVVLLKNINSVLNRLKKWEEL